MHNIPFNFQVLKQLIQKGHWNPLGVGKWIRNTENKKERHRTDKTTYIFTFDFFNDPTTILGPRSVPSDQKLQRGRQPLHLVHYGGAL